MKEVGVNKTKDLGFLEWVLLPMLMFWAGSFTLDLVSTNGGIPAQYMLVLAAFLGPILGILWTGGIAPQSWGVARALFTSFISGLIYPVGVLLRFWEIIQKACAEHWVPLTQQGEFLQRGVRWSLLALGVYAVSITLVGLMMCAMRSDRVDRG